MSRSTLSDASRIGDLYADEGGPHAPSGPTRCIIEIHAARVHPHLDLYRDRCGVPDRHAHRGQTGAAERTGQGQARALRMRHRAGGRHARTLLHPLLLGSNPLRHLRCRDDLPASVGDPVRCARIVRPDRDAGVLGDLDRRVCLDLPAARPQVGLTADRI